MQTELYSRSRGELKFIDIMFCRNCGSTILDGLTACLCCGVRVGTGYKFCPECGEEPDPQAVICVKCGANLKLNTQQMAQTVSQPAATYSYQQPTVAVKSFGEAIKVCFDKYANFTGRANKNEFWFWTLFTFLFGLIPPINIIASLVFFLPSLAVTVRRLHDSGKSGLWALLMMIPFIGWAWLIVLLCEDSEPHDNQYGPTQIYE